MERTPAEPEAVIRASSKVTITSMGPPLAEIWSNCPGCALKVVKIFCERSEN